MSPPPPKRPNSGRPGTGRQAARPGTGRQAAPEGPAAARTGAGDNAGRDASANQRGLIGVGLIVLGGVFGVLGLWLGWAGWVRWEGIDDLTTAWSLQINGNDATRKEYAHRAAIALPNEAAAVLMDIDFSSDEAAARLDELSRRDPRNGAIIATAQAMVGALKGVSPSQDIGPGDGEMLSILAALVRGDPPQLLPSSPKGESHQSVQFATYSRQLQAALRVGDPEMIKQVAGMIQLAMPTHPQAALVALIATVCDDKAKSTALDAATMSIKDAAARYYLCNALGPLVPSRQDELAAMGLGVPLSNNTDLLGTEVSAAPGIPAADLGVLVDRRLRADRIDLVNRLMPHLAPTDSEKLSTMMLVHGGDLQAMMATHKPEMRPKLGIIAGRHHGLSFQLSNDVGTIPTSRITVTMAGKDVTKDRITQHGTLYSISADNPPLSGPTEVEIQVGDTSIWHGSVTL